jgi:adenylate cyclase 10
MTAYPNIVSCDQETLIQSKMNLKHFNQLPKRALKGIKALKPVYEFRDILDFDKLSVSANDYEEIYGRHELLRSVNLTVASTIESFNDGGNQGGGARALQKPCFIIRSDSQEGKSAVINKLFRDYHETELRCARLILNTKHTTMHFWIIKYLAMKIFGSENYEVLVMQKLSKFKVDSYFFLLNDIFDTKFKRPRTMGAISTEHVKALQQLLLTALFKQSAHFWIVLIDDADFIDSQSMNFLNSIMDSQTIYFVLTVGKQQKRWTFQQKNFYRDVTLYCLRPIDKTFHKDIACQSINVSAISIEFERFLQHNSNGNPGWIETCAKTLLYSGKLKIKSLTIMEAVIDGMVLKNDLMIHDATRSGGDFFDIVHTAAANAAALVKAAANRSDESIDVAVVVQGELTEKDYVVSVVSSSKLMLFDSLSSHEQAVCKCASVLGLEFERAMLNYLLPTSNLRVIGRTITKLFQLNILYCASTKEKHDDAMWAIKNEVISCNCSNLEILESCRDMPKYASCAHLTFHDERFRKYIYDTLTEKLLREYHKKCIIYLYRNNKNCSQCGNESFESIDEIKINYRDGFIKFGKNQDRTKRKLLERELKFPANEKLDCKQRLKTFPLVLNYLNYDFRSCKCEQILSEMMTQIVEHCQGKEMIVKKIYSQVTLADICLKSSNFPRAISLLESAAEKLNVRNMILSKNGVQ